MEFLFSEDQEQFRENIARFLADRSPTTEVRKLMADEQGYDPEVWSMLSNQLGLCGIAVAEQYGGAGFGPQELAIACEEMGRALYCGPFMASAVCAATSSMEQMLMVDKVKGTPNSSAAWAARISPSARCMPARPVGANATGMDH